MKLHLILAGATALASAALVACSSTVGITPTPPPPAPTPAAALRYAGKITQTYTYVYGYPSPQPPTTIKTSVKDSVTVFPATVHGLPAGTQDVHVDETDQTPLLSTSTVTDAYVNETSSQRLLYGSKSKFEAAAGGQSGTTTTTYASAQILSKSHGTWTNSPAGTIDEKYSDGHYEDRTIAADGTYDEKGSTFALSGKPAAIELAEKLTGAGSYTGPFLGCPPLTSWKFTAAPSITVKLVSSVPSCQVAASKIPEWYPVGPTFYRERDRVKSRATVPAQCGPAAGKTARLTDRTIARLDTVIGYFEYTDVSVFGSLTGAPVCMVLGDEIDNYYDWQGDQIAFFVFTPHGDPVSTIVTDENLVLEGGASSSASRGGTLSFRDDALAAGAQAHFLARLGVLRANLRDAMMRRLMKLADPSGGPR